MDNAKRNQAVIDFLKTRRSVPAKIMGGPGPSAGELRQIIAIASRVPDHGKIAPWRFVNYGDAAKKRLGELILARALEKQPDLSPELAEIERTRFSRSPQVVAMFSKPVDHPKVPEWEQLLSAGAAGMNFLNAANAYGYDAQWLTEWYAFDETLQEALGTRTGEKIAGFFHIGTRTMPKTERARPEISDIYSLMER